MLDEGTISTQRRKASVCNKCRRVKTDCKHTTAIREEYGEGRPHDPGRPGRGVRQKGGGGGGGQVTKRSQELP